MRIAVLGTGVVGATLATKLLELNHEVAMGSRDAAGEAATAWLTGLSPELQARASTATFADAAAGAELVVNATSGAGSLTALGAAGAPALAGKVLIDVANPLDFSQGFPPRLSVCNDDSLGEQIQAAFPDALVVKALNTLSAAVMVDPARVPGPHVLFVAGNDSAAKAATIALLGQFGWPEGRIIDMGDITAARASEMYLPLWLRLMGANNTGDFNISVNVAD